MYAYLNINTRLGTAKGAVTRNVNFERRAKRAAQTHQRRRPRLPLSFRTSSTMRGAEHRPFDGWLACKTIPSSAKASCALEGSRRAAWEGSACEEQGRWEGCARRSFVRSMGRALDIRLAQPNSQRYLTFYSPPPLVGFFVHEDESPRAVVDVYTKTKTLALSAGKTARRRTREAVSVFVLSRLLLHARGRLRRCCGPGNRPFDGWRAWETVPSSGGGRRKRCGPWNRRRRTGLV